MRAISGKALSLERGRVEPGSVLALILAGFLVLLGPASMAQGPNPGDTGEGAVVPGPVRQPAVQSSGLGLDILGVPTGNGAPGSPEPDFNLNRCGPAIVVGFGQVVYDQTDLFIKGRDEVTNLVISRRHLSTRDQTNSIFGPAWAFNYDHYLVRRGDDEDVHLTSFGRTDLFKKVSADKWEGQVGRFDLLTYAAGKYTLRMPHGTLLEFTADDAATAVPGHLTKITSPNGNTLEFTYETAAQQADLLKRKLLTITDSFGRDIDFFYGVGVNASQVTGIKEFTGSGREVKYTYNNEGQLLSVRSPTVTSTGGLNEFAGGKRYTYQYLGSASPGLENALKAVVFPNQVADGTNTPRYQWSYDQNSTKNPYFGTVKTFTLGAGTFSYAYRALAAPPKVPDDDPETDDEPKVNAALREVTVTDRMGTKTVYKTNYLGQVLEEKVVTRALRGAGGPKSYAKSFQYNADGQLTRRDDEMGSRTEYLYSNRDRELNGPGDPGPDGPAQDNPRNVEFPMTNVVRFADVRGGNQTVIQSKTIYEPLFNKPFKVVDPRGYDRAEAGLPLIGPLTQAQTDAYVALRDRFTTTYSYDYMEDYPANEGALAALLGVANLSDVLPPGGFPNAGEFNADGNTTQKAGNVVKIQYPVVAPPAAPLPSGTTPADLGFTASAAETYQYNDFGQLTRHTDADGNVTTNAYYDATDHSGTAGTGYLKETVRDFGGVNQTTSYEYVAQAVELDPGGAAANFPANLRGVPTATIDPRGVKTAYLVNELDQVIKRVNAAAVNGRAGAEANLTPFSYETLVLYDANNNVVEGCAENENKDATLGATVDDLIINRAAYDLLDQVIETGLDVDQPGDLGEVVVAAKFQYDKNQNLVMALRGDPETVDRDEYAVDSASYDERDLIINQTLAAVGESEAEKATFGRKINANGQLVTIVDGEDIDAAGITDSDEAATADAADGAVGGDPTEIKYDGFNRRREVIERDGDITRYTYDSASNVIRVEHLSDDRKTALETTETKYDERNRPTRMDALASGEGGGVISHFSLYDSLGRVVATVDAENDLERTDYDGLSRVLRRTDAEGNISENEYDANSNVKTTTTIEKKTTDGTTETFVTRSTYDALNRQVSIVEPNLQDTIASYDSRDNLVRTTDALGNQTRMTYDRLDRLVKEETFLSADGQNATSTTNNGVITKRYEYDDLHRLMARIDDKGARVEYTYDDLNRRTKTTFEDGSEELSVYNDDGELVKFTDRNGTVINRTYNADSRLLRETAASDDPPLLGGRRGTTEKTWSYDDLDRVVQTSDNNGPGDEDNVTCAYTYDTLSRNIRETQSVGGIGLSVDTEWNGAEHKAASVYPNGRRVLRVYDDLDRLIDITEADETPIAHFDYVGTSLRTLGGSYGNGATLTKEYDSNQRATKTEWKKGQQQITSYLNTFNAVNRRVSENRKHLNTGASDTNVDSYTFDSAHRMTGFRRDGTGIGAGGVVSNRTHDGADMMTAFTDEGTVRPLTVSTNKLNQYSSVDGNTRAYDKNANLDDWNTALSDTADLEFVQDYDNRIVEVRKGDEKVVVKYAYDAMGRRVLRTMYGAGGITITAVTRYIYDGWQVVEERDVKGGNDTVLRQYVDGRGIDEHIQMSVYSPPAGGIGPPNREDYYYHCNDQGFVGGLTDSTGEIVEYYEYGWLGKLTILDGVSKLPITDPDGSTPGIESTVGNPYAFQGRRLDTETGNYYYRHRYYNPDLGQFLSIDPLGLWNHGQGNGASAFAEDPWNYNDPLGTEPYRYKLGQYTKKVVKYGSKLVGPTISVLASTSVLVTPVLKGATLVIGGVTVAAVTPFAIGAVVVDSAWKLNVARKTGKHITALRSIGNNLQNAPLGVVYSAAEFNLDNGQTVGLEVQQVTDQKDELRRLLEYAIHQKERKRKRKLLAAIPIVGGIGDAVYSVGNYGYKKWNDVPAGTARENSAQRLVWWTHAGEFQDIAQAIVRELVGESSFERYKDSHEDLAKIVAEKLQPN